MSLTPNSPHHPSGPSVRGVKPIAQMTGDDELDSTLLQQMAADAAKYLMSFDWCSFIRSTHFGDGYGGIVAVFLLQIVPTRPEVDEWLWVVVGDVPSAYFVTDDLKTPRAVLDAFIWHRSQWVECVQSGRPVADDIMPVYVPPTLENAKALSTRLEVIKTELLPFFVDG